jgi:hypothetical protein
MDAKMDALNPETLKLLQSVLEDTWDSLRPCEKARTTKTEVAVRILKLAARGERDPDRLRIEAVSGVVTSPL